MSDEIDRVDGERHQDADEDGGSFSEEAFPGDLLMGMGELRPEG